MAQDSQQLPDWFVSGDDSQREMSLVDFYRVIPYQRKLFFTVMATILVLGFIAINLLPKSYSSESSILMERESTFAMRSDGARPEALNLRMRTIIATLLSSSSVESMLVSLGIIEENAPKDLVRGMVNGFKNNVAFEFDNVSFINENTGRAAEYSMGFTVSYTDSSPELAFLGTEELTRRVLSYSSDRMAQRAETETAFLRESMTRAAEKLKAAEDDLTEFKRTNSTALPHMRDVNLRRIEDLNRRILNSSDRLVGLRDRLEETEAQLSSISIDAAVYSTTGQRIVSPRDQLTMLELEYAAQKNKYSPNHPDIVRMEEEIAALKIHLNSDVGEGGMEEELMLERQNLSRLRERYSDKHPDIAESLERITYLEQQIKAGNTRSRDQVGASNPIYNNLLSRQRSVRTEIRLEQNEQQNLREELRTIDSGMQLLPGVEQDLRYLEKIRDTAEEKFTELEEELAETVSTLEARDAELSEKFVLLEAPVMPVAPSKPNKLLLMMVVGLLSFIAAYAFVFIRHMIKDTILDSGDVEQVTSLPVYLIPEFK